MNKQKTNEYIYKWRENNPEKYKEIQKKAVKKYQEEHKKEMRRNGLSYYYRHRKEILQKMKERREKNKENI